MDEPKRELPFKNVPVLPPKSETAPTAEPQPAAPAPGSETAPKTLRKPLFFTGLLITAATGLFMTHFTISYAIAKFPPGALTSGRNWIFIGLHVLGGIAGLFLMARSRK